jgi:hypothetical protein
LKQIDAKKASGIIKFLTGSCLSGLGIVLKEPKVIYFMDQASVKALELYELSGQVLSLRTLIHEFFQPKFNDT